MRCPRSRLANGVPGSGGAPLPGTKTRCQELADGRGWSTCRKRGPYARKHRRGAPRGARASREGSAAYGKSVAPHRRATPSAFLPGKDSPKPLWAEGKRSEEHTSELQSHVNLVCRLLLEKK